MEIQVVIPIDGLMLTGNLILPDGAHGLVIFSHGSGSSRLSPRNQHVAKVIQQKKIGTLLFDLFTEKEDRIYENRFDIDLLTERMTAVTRWVKEQPFAANLSIGYFGASTGAASALRAAAELPIVIKAIVSRGGRPDMANDALSNVTAPTLMIVGGLDTIVLSLNKDAYAQLKSRKELIIIPGATHLFEEPGTLEQVAEAAVQWFGKYL